MPTPILYYFPGNLSMPFGHVALGVAADATLAPAGYLSYGAGRGKSIDKVAVYDAASENKEEYQAYLNLQLEKNLYTHVIAIPLPACTADQLHAAMQQFGKMDRSQYTWYSQNCANAVLNFMKTIGCIPTTENYLSPLRPQVIAKRAAEIALQQIQQERIRIKAAKTVPVLKIIALIRNDINRLLAQINYDEVAHLIYKIKANKDHKIKVLDNLAKIAESARTSLNQADFQTLYQALVDARLLSSKTAKHIDECLYYFPTDLVDATFLYEATVKTDTDVAYFTKQREMLLQDDELAEIELMEALLDNEIAQLRAEVVEVQSSSFTLFKSAAVKTDEIVKLVALKQFFTPSIDYAQLWFACVSTLNDPHLTASTKQQLQQCFDCFPYDAVSASERGRTLQCFNNIELQLSAAQQQGDAVSLDKTAIAALKTIRQWLPLSDQHALLLTTKELLERHYNISHWLKENCKLPSNNPALDLFYEGLFATVDLTYNTRPHLK